MSKPWADGPFKLCAIPTCDPTAHTAYEMAWHMVGVHNVFIRNINAVYRQAPHVKLEQDQKDLAQYIIFWIDGLQGHHDQEEEVAFPAFEAVSNGEWKSVGDRNREEHAAFEAALKELRGLAEGAIAASDQYDGVKINATIDKLMTPLGRHLQHEIETLEGLAKYEDKAIRKISDDLNKVIEKNTDPYKLSPLMFGGHDTTFSDNKALFPQFPFFVRYLVHYVFESKYRSVWRFNPCTTWGKPQELPFLAS